MPIFRTKVRGMGKLSLLSLFVRTSRHIVIDQYSFGVGHNLSLNQVPMGVALGCEDLGRPDEVSFGRAGIGGGVTFCREKIAYRIGLGELGPRRLSRTRHIPANSPGRRTSVRFSAKERESFRPLILPNGL